MLDAEPEFESSQPTRPYLPQTYPRRGRAPSRSPSLASEDAISLDGVEVEDADDPMSDLPAAVATTGSSSGSIKRA